MCCLLLFLLNIMDFLVGGWTNPLEKYARQIGSFPQIVGVKIQKIFELPPPSYTLTIQIPYYEKWDEFIPKGVGFDPGTFGKLTSLTLVFCLRRKCRISTVKLLKLAHPSLFGTLPCLFWRRRWSCRTVPPFNRPTVSLGIFLVIWAFPKIGVPQNGWLIMENTIKIWMIWGYHYFWKHPYSQMMSVWGGPNHRNEPHRSFRFQKTILSFGELIGSLGYRRSAL